MTIDMQDMSWPCFHEILNLESGKVNEVKWE